jgi:hypothetical protein
MVVPWTKASWQCVGGPLNDNVQEAGNAACARSPNTFQGLMTRTSLSPLLLEYGNFFVGIILAEQRHWLQRLEMWAQHVVAQSQNTLADTTMAARGHVALSKGAQDSSLYNLAFHCWPCTDSTTTCALTTGVLLKKWISSTDPTVDAHKSHTDLTRIPHGFYRAVTETLRHLRRITRISERNRTWISTGLLQNPPRSEKDLTKISRKSQTHVSRILVRSGWICI